MKQKTLITAIITIFIAGNCFTCNASTVDNKKSNVSERQKTLTAAINKNHGRACNDSKFYISSANSLLQKGMLQEAEKMAKKAINISYNDPDAFIALGNIYFEKSNLLGNSLENRELKKTFMLKAFENFYTAYKYNPASPFAHIGLANAYYMNGQDALARDEMLKVKELSVKNAEALYLIGEYYYKTKEYAKSKKYLEKSISAGMTSKYKTYFLLGMISEKDGNIQDAQKNYISALKIKPDDFKSQQNLDRLIKVTYKEAESLSNNLKATATNLYSNVNEELNTLKQADSYLLVDEFTTARELYVKIIENNPDNINAITGLAELYYLEWIEGFANYGNFVNDAKYILNIEENSKTVIPLIKFKLINEDEMPENIRQKLISLSVSETFDFYDQLNEARAEFLLGNFKESHEKFQKLLNLDLSNYEKLKVLKSLCNDHDYYEAVIFVNNIQKTYYHNDELQPIINRINVKFGIVDEKLTQAIALYSNKKNKKNNYADSEFIIKLVIKYFPTSKKAYLDYVYLLEKQKKYSEAIEKFSMYEKLNSVYPNQDAEITETDMTKLSQRLNKKLEKAEKKN